MELSVLKKIIVLFAFLFINILKCSSTRNKIEGSSNYNELHITERLDLEKRSLVIAILSKYFQDGVQLNIIDLLKNADILTTCVFEIFETLYKSVVIYDVNRSPSSAGVFAKDSYRITNGLLYLVLVDNVTSLNEIFTGVKEVLPLNTRAKFLIVTFDPKVDTKWIQHLFHLLWMERILNVEVIINNNVRKNHDKSCMHMVTYNPFERNRVMKEGNRLEIKLITRNVNQLDRLFPEKTKNVYKYPLLISEVNPIGFRTVVRNKDGSVNKTSDLLASLIKSMNFTPVVVKAKFQYRLVNIKVKNGTWIGPIAEVASSYSDICSYQYLMLNDRTKVVDYCVVYRFGEFSWVSPSSVPVPQWQCFFHPLSKEIWMAFPLLFMYIYISELLVQRMVTRCRNFKSKCNTVLYVLSIFLQIAVPEPKSKPSKAILILSVLGFIIISSLYQSSLLSYMVTPKYYPNIDTLKDIMKSDLKLEILPQHLRALRDFPNMNLKKLFTRFQISPNITRSVELVCKRGDRIVFIALGSTKAKGINAFIHGRFTFHFSKEHLGINLVSYIVSKNSPYLDRFNLIIQRMVEAGLRHKDFIENDDINRHRHLNTEADDLGNKVVLTLYHFQALFFLFILGLGLSLLVFVLEIIISYFKNKTDLLAN